MDLDIYSTFLDVYEEHWKPLGCDVNIFVCVPKTLGVLKTY